MPASKPLDDLSGVVLDGKYRLLQRIGRGGFGVVYSAEHVVTRRRFAVKTLLLEHREYPKLSDRFLREATTTARIEHENIVEILDVGRTSDGILYFSMELLKGETLEQLIAREARLPLSRTLSIISQVCEATHAAHIRGIIHRDLKPANIFLTTRAGRADFVKVLDFGIAKLLYGDEQERDLTGQYEILGTPLYMSPEQAAGDKVDRRSDVYSTGIIIFELLTGVRPFNGRNHGELVRNIFSGAVPRMLDVAPAAAIPHALEAVVAKAMAREPDARYPDMQALASALQMVANQSSSAEDEHDELHLARTEYVKASSRLDSKVALQRTRLHPFPGSREARKYAPTQARASLDVVARAARGGMLLRYHVHGEPRHVVERMHDTATALRLADRFRLAPEGGSAMTLGQELSRVLFGDPGSPEYNRLFRFLFRRPGEANELAVGPSFAPVRCRLITDTPAMRALPWQLLADGENWLADDGWTVEVADDLTPGENVRLPGPCTILLIAPEASGQPLDPARHVADIQDLLRRTWPLAANSGRLGEHVILATTWPGIQQILRERSPHVVYFYGRVFQKGGPPTLRIDLAGGGQGTLEISRLFEAASGKAQVLFLNLLARDPVNVFTHEPVDIPCVIGPSLFLNPSLADDLEVDTRGLAWIEALLRRGYDPVSAQHVVMRENVSAYSASMVARTRFRTWRTDTAPTERFPEKVRLYLDRTAQRGQLLEVTRQLVAHRVRRVESIVACSPPGHCSENLGELLYRHVHENSIDRVQIARFNLPFPASREDLPTQLRELFEDELLDRQADEPLRRALIRTVARGPLQRDKGRILWIDWGVVGDIPERPPLESFELDDWFRFGAEELATACPDELRIVSFLAVQASVQGCEALEDYLDREIPETSMRSVLTTLHNYTRLPRLGDVNLHDIMNYLDLHSSCPKDLIHEVGSALVSITGGRYEKVVAMLEEVESGTKAWPSLARTGLSVDGSPPQRSAKRKIFR